MPWLFFRGETGTWRWVHLAEDGTTTAESQACFDTRLACVADAKASGFGDDPEPLNDAGASR